MADEKTQISIRVPNEVIAKMDRIAVGIERDRSYVMNEAFKAYLEAEGAEILEDLDGIEDLDAGNGVDFDETISKARAIVASKNKAQRAG